VIGLLQGGSESAEVGTEHLKATRIMLGESDATGNDMQGSAASGSRFRQNQRATLEIDRQEPNFPGNLRSGRPPSETASDHQMEHEEEIPVDLEHYPFAQPVQCGNRATHDRRERRGHRA
jgi:hypothetical protein